MRRTTDRPGREVTARNSRSQTPEKSRNRNTKHQIPNTEEIPSSKLQTALRAFLVFRAWYLVFLEFGALRQFSASSSQCHPDTGGGLAIRSDGAMEGWSAESTNTPPLHRSVWDHADSMEMTNRRTGSGGLSPRLDQSRQTFVKGRRIRQVLAST